VTSEHTGDLQEIGQKEIRRLQNEPLQRRIDRHSTYQAGIFCFENSTPSELLGQLNFIDQNGLDDTYLTNRVKDIYAVTPEKISQMKRTHSSMRI